MLYDSLQYLYEHLLVLIKCFVILKLSFYTFSYGDEIIEINDTVVYNMALNDVYTVLSQCPPGPVHIIISRHPNPKVRNTSSQCTLCADHPHLNDHLEKLEP